MITVDQYTRWLCDKCGKAGIDSWNKALYDGNPAPPAAYGLIFGDSCQYCMWPVTVRYPAPDMAPRAIYGPIPYGDRQFSYETDAMLSLEFNLGAGEPLQPSTERDRDWSGGCSRAPAS